ncbi:MAG TPA: SDR family oxidoreductase [Kofleriaceae bacterium]|nr:SDR family oxidoreductase [Kofleriaceae bacterium]
MSKVLVVGATGVLGTQIALGLLAAGRGVRALVRESSDPAKVAALRDAGAELVMGDLKQPESLARACAGVSHLILTASSTLSRVEGDSIESVDRLGNLALIDAAKAAGIERFVFVSFPRHELSFPLQDAKLAVEAALVGSGLGYTILQPPHFWEIWASPALGFDIAGGKARIFGTGEGQNSWISLFDVAKAAIAALDRPAAQNRAFAFGGPEPLSQLEIVRRVTALRGQDLELERIPAEALRAQLAGADGDLPRSFAALMLITGEGRWVFDPSEAREALGIELASIDAYLAQAAQAAQAAQ